jgi:ABC-type amino acid transport substrate-binding protein
VHFYPKTENALAAVDSGEADACLADQSVPDFLLLHPECTTLTDENNEPVRTSIDYSHPMIKPGDQRFLNWVDNWMDFHAVQGTIEQIKQEAHTAFRAKFERIVGMSED